MPATKRPEDWTEEHVTRFWGYQCSRDHTLHNYFTNTMGRAICRFLQLNNVLRGNVLDFGCGPGFLSERLLDFPIELSAIDSSLRSIEVTRKKCEGCSGFREATRCSGLPTPYAAETFDLIVCVETVEHLPMDFVVPLLTEFHRLLKPGGHLFVSTPHNEDLAAGMSYCPFCDSEYHYMQHFQSFSADRLNGKLTEAGFHTSYCRGIQLGFFDNKLLPGGWGPTAIFRRLVHFGTSGLALVSPKRLGRAVMFHGRIESGPHLVALAQRP